MKVKFTKASVEKLPPSKQGRAWYNDSELPGFRVAVSTSGRRYFYVRLRSGGRADRQERSVAIGAFGVLTVEQARERAKDLLSRHQLGIPTEPAPERQESHEEQGKSFAALCEGFLAEKVGKKKAKTIKEYRRLIERELKPAFGERLGSSLASEDVAAWHARLGQRAPIVANNALRLMRTIFGWAHNRRHVAETVHPTRGIEKFPEHPKERFLSHAEIARLGAALQRRANLADGRSGPSAAIRFLLLSGWRKNEALSLRWDAIDWAREQVSLVDSKTGPCVRQLSGKALDMLREIPRVHGSPWVFPGADPSQHLVCIKRQWNAIRNECGFTDVRLHDLRHTFASIGLEQGLSLEHIGRLLGHKSTRSTQRYAHLSEGAVRQAANSTADFITRMMGGRHLEAA